MFIVSYKELLWDEPPTPESEASCALFYSISSTQVNKVAKNNKFSSVMGTSVTTNWCLEV